MSIDWTKPVRRKDTKEVLRVLCTDRPGNLKQCVLCMYPSGVLESFDKDGNHFYDAQSLENVPEEIMDAKTLQKLAWILRGYGIQHNVVETIYNAMDMYANFVEQSTDAVTYEKELLQITADWANKK